MKRKEFYGEVKGSACKVGLTLNDVAKNIGVSFATLNRGLNNPDKLDCVRLKAIFRAAKVDKDDAVKIVISLIGY